jgi:glycosyltransferase involved in cell wall biosynthesis
MQGMTPLPNDAPRMVLGVTCAQTCLILTARLRAFREAGFRVTVVSAPGELLDRTAAAAGVEAVAIPMHRGIALGADFLSLCRIIGLLWHIRPDLVEFSTPKAGLLGMLAAWICRVPHRIYLLRGLRLEASSGTKRRILMAAEQLAAACAQVVVCNSESLRCEALVWRLAAPSKLRVLGGGSSNGVDTEIFFPWISPVRGQLGIPEDALVIGFVGRLTRDKGIPELAEAFERILESEPRAFLLLVGWFDASEDALPDALRHSLEHHERIRVTGLVAETAPYYRAMDVFVLPSWREGFPNAVLEAAATELPVVTTESTGARDSVVPEVTGLLIPPGYPEAIAESVLMLLADADRRRQMGQAARAWVLKHYLCREVLGRTVAFYQALGCREKDPEKEGVTVA